MSFYPNKISPFLVLLAILFSFCCFAEGTKQLRPDSTYTGDLWIINGGSGSYNCFATSQCGPNQRLYIHIAHAGEKIFMGFGTPLNYITFVLKLNGTVVNLQNVFLTDGVPGYIKYHSQAIAGPRILNPHGYVPVTFSPAEPGDYSIEFELPPAPQDPQIGMRLFDITVIDTTKTPFVPIDGRLWSRDWGFNTYDCTPTTDAFLATQYILTSDSIVTSVNYNHMRGWNFDVTSTRNGCYPWPEPWDSSCRSRTGNHHYAQYKIFINDPDSLEYPTGTLGVILGDTVSVSRSCDGSFSFSFAVNKPGNVKLNIETNLAPGIQPEDLTLNRTVNQGVNTFLWNGRNGLGVPVSCGDSVAITVNYINGLTNIALFDVEKQPKGFIIELVRPQGAPIASYWNDTLLYKKGGQTQLTGCYSVPPDGGCHIWDGNAGYGLGSGNTLNTWWYAVSSVLTLGRFRVECVPHIPDGITGADTLCTSSTGTYTIDPEPLPGSEPLGYEWVLTDASTGGIIFDSLNIGPAIKLEMSDYPAGQMRLKVRGRSDLCGTGLFGPVNGGTGILITSVPSTQITNSMRTFSICSGDSTNILLQSSLPGSVYSYIARSTSPSTGGQSSGNMNPIRQILINSGNRIDSVIYYVVPYLAPCAGDTVPFIVKVNPSDSVNFSIVASANPVCEGSQVTFSVASLIGGPSAVFEWKVDGASAGPNAPVFSYIPTNGDKVQCTIGSSEFCTPGKMAYSEVITMKTTPRVAVSLTLSHSVDPVCKGEPLSVNALPVNGGTSPVYQWWVNGNSVGADSSVYNYSPGIGDIVICKISSNLSCVLNNQSADTLHVNVKDDLKIIDTLICYGTGYFAGGAWQTAEGNYLDTLATPVSCIRFIETKLKFKPKIPLELGNDTIICGNFLELNPNIPGGTYLWQDGSSDSVFTVTRPGEYSVAITLDGCFQSDSIIIGDCPVILWVPNSFTPNGDGINDTFHPKGTQVENFSMKIFNRWGEIIFQTSSIENGWDGMINGELCGEGAYVFIITYKGEDGKTVQQKGTIILQR